MREICTYDILLAMSIKNNYETPQIKVLVITMQGCILTLSGDNEPFEPGDDIGSDED